ncbi:26S proteasome non-ATPase regulatory subunit [Myotisia sp. PD_48]|nr:26S proteasome non-ATPase regulatory subunit [Myotisia sp. PD_48]
MPAEKRSLRSNSEKPRSNSQSSGSTKDKPAPARSAPARGKPALRKHALGPKGGANNIPEEQNGADPVGNGVHDESDDVKMGDHDDAMNGSVSPRHIPEADADEEMSLSPLSKPPGEVERNDLIMDEPLDEEAEAGKVKEVDPVEKARTDIKANFVLLERAVAHFDARFTLRVLRSISSIRKQLSADLLASIIVDTFRRSDLNASFLLAAIDKGSAFDTAANEGDVIMQGATQSKRASTGPLRPQQQNVLPEIVIYLSILIQIYLYDNQHISQGAQFSSRLVERLRTFNRRTLDSLSSKVYFYYSLFFEQVAPLPPSPTAAIVETRQPLLAALRTAVLRKDVDIQATVTTLLLRNYLCLSHISQADLFISHSEFPAGASNNQIARYLYYLGKIRAIQLQYSEAHQHLTGATRKAPATHSAGGFYQAAMKLLVVVELLMGDIPDRAVFRQPALERAMHPYFLLVRAVSVGDLDGFQKIVQAHNPVFRRDGTYTLILRLRQNVIKTGVRIMSLSYSRISLRDICVRLGLDSEESAEYIVAKAIRDGVIEASLDHEDGYMKSKEIGDVYATQEPGEIFHERIQACLDLHDESVKAMRFPMNQHRLELKNAREAQEREKELANEIAGDIDDDDDAGGDFDV